jgi:hypothetical protein
MPDKAGVFINSFTEIEDDVHHLFLESLSEALEITGKGNPHRRVSQSLERLLNGFHLGNNVNGRFPVFVPLGGWLVVDYTDLFSPQSFSSSIRGGLKPKKQSPGSSHCKGFPPEMR